MSQQSSGLRFDIYERVHLPDDGAGIKELTSIELSPEITVDRQGEQAVLKGNLLLSGSYTSVDESRREEHLTHSIPVEITLPMNRIHNVNDISVEIENFDVDLLSTRSLNVTGVLSLNGIEMVNSATADWREEEVVFTHRADDAATSVQSDWTGAYAAAAQPQSTPEYEAAPAAPETVERDSVPGETVTQAVNETVYEPVDETVETAGTEATATEVPEEKKEIKIAFSGKPAEEEIQQSQFSGVNTLLSASPEGAAREEGAQTDATGADDSNAQPVAAAAGVKGSADSEGRERVEWKKLFLSASEDEPRFRKVRMCIAQKEDTIETIAERYKKNPRELMLYNRLNEQYLQEGQVVYIP
ncbi:LysM peptidoglycan-binding domain-containing protein [Paenibacillus alkalitolerans]|uniref:LysM peptidoglycan-binding domain-containing protein n=1 Tax=Paenibacillus alkalitolerans TaxID=2799335 RepID=UPI002D7FDAFD|nr:LysM peptidoglycan-binding domain-containing protein [Paenibacillus alkalitolerans]